MSEASFSGLLDRYNAAPDDAARRAVEADAWAHYGAEKGVLVQDMSGFSLLTRRHGILHYLSMTRRMQVATTPIVMRHRGEVIKYEADNLFAVFDQVADAVRAAVTINMALEAMNTMTEEARDIHVASGIAFGRLLLLPGGEFFGDCVNVACKLGEDLAQRGDILLTEEAYAQVKDAGVAVEPLQHSISGLALSTYRVLY